MSTGPPLSALLQELLARAAQLLGTQHGYLCLVTPDERAIEAQSGIGLFAEYVGERRQSGEGLVGRVWSSGEALAVQDYRSWEGRSPRFAGDVVGALMGVPLRSGGRVVGVLGVAHEAGSPRAFGEEDVRLMSSFAQLASIALENAQLYNQVRRELAEREQAEAALAATEARYRELVEQATDIIYWTDTEGRFTDANPITLRVLGFTHDELIGRNSIDIIRPDWRRRAAEFFLQQLRSRFPPRSSCRS